MPAPRLNVSEVMGSELSSTARKPHELVVGRLAVGVADVHIGLEEGALGARGHCRRRDEPPVVEARPRRASSGGGVGIMIVAP